VIYNKDKQENIMKIGIISFTANGSRLCGQLCRELGEKGHHAEGYAVSKYAKEEGLKAMEGSVDDWTKEAFDKMDSLIFIGACGIAVRSIAPYLRDKTVDPAVLVIDELGSYIISLLSGHIGGANALALELESITGGTAIITTATDLNCKFAVDVFAKINQLYITSMKKAKKISAAVLDGENVFFACEFPVQGGLPDNLQVVSKEEILENNCLGINISLTEQEKEPSKVLSLIPKIVTVGIGCRKDVDKESVEHLIMEVLQKQNLSIHCVEQVVSVDLKKNEAGIIEFAKEHQLPFKTYSVQELREVEGDFTPSDFVKMITGVSNICERSAVLGSGNGRLIEKKTVKNGVTVALAIKEWRAAFE
jgi:cobalt-precorrin 5A hydrolase